MKILSRALVALVVALPVFFFVSCTSDLDPVVIAADGYTYSQDEFDSLVQSGVLDTNGRAIDTTKASGKDSASSVSSSSEIESSETSDTTLTSSDSADAESSSSEEEESSSSVPESSSSYEAVFGSGTVGESIIAKDGILSIGTDAMSEVSGDDAESLDSVKAVVDGGSGELPEGFSDFGVESTMEEFNYESFIENKFYCLTKEGSWLEISRLKLAENIPHFKNGASLGPLESFKVSFADACSAVYSRQ